MPTKVEISHRTIIFILVLLASIWFVLQIRDILFLLFVSFILVSALRPLVDWLEARKLPRVLAILLLYAIVFGFIGASIASMIPSLAVQSSKLSEQLPRFLDRMFPAVSLDLQSISQQIAPIGQNILSVTVGIFSNIVTVLTVLTFTFYFLLERGNLRNLLSGLFGENMGGRAFAIMVRVEKRLGAWVMGQLLLMVIIGASVYVGLFFLKVEFALPLAIMAGLLEIVPMVGPIISAIPAVLVAFAHSPLLALSVIALYVIIQQIENNIIVPMVMKRSVGLSPVLTILALMIGGRFAGIIGAVLAVPILLTVQEVVSSLTNNPPAKRV